MSTRTPEQVTDTRIAQPATGAGVRGLHHVATVSADVARAADFYERVLGLRALGEGPAPLLDAGRLVEAPARFFGDAAGHPGSLVAVLDRPRAERGAPGIGGTHHFALAVPDREALLMWKRRFLDEGYAVNGILDRHYFQSIYVQDPDGTIVELATQGPGWTIDEEAAHVGEAHRAPPPEMLNTNRDRARIAAENWGEPVAEIGERIAIRGLHHVTAIGADIERTHGFVGGRLGMRRVKRTNNFDDAASFHWYWGVGAGVPGSIVTYFERRPERERPARMGAGQVTHYAVAAPGAAIEPMRDALAGAGLAATSVEEFGPDGARFRAIATVDPDGQVAVVASADGALSYAPEAAR